MKIATITIWARLHTHEDMRRIELEPHPAMIPIARALVDGMVVQGYEATLCIETSQAEIYHGPDGLTAKLKNDPEHPFGDNSAETRKGGQLP